MPHTADATSETAPPAARTSWTGLAARVFSFPVMCMFLLVLLIFGRSVRGIGDPDIWWHLRNAAYLFQHHSFPNVDTYSFGAAGAPWLNFEWLSEVPFFLGFRAVGLQGLLTVYFAVLVLIYVGVYYRSCRAGADCKDAAIVTFLAILLGAVSISPRTLLFGWLCMVGLLLVLDHFQRTGKGLWLLPPLFALWINLHASWVFGMVVLTLTIASGLVGGEWGLVEARRWTSGELKRLLSVFAASLAVLFVNPFGYRLLLYPFDLLLRHQGFMQYIEEWQSVDFSNSNGKLALILIFSLMAAALFSRRQWRLDEVLLTAFALWAALSHGRFLFFAGLIVPPILAPRLKLFPPYRPEIDKLWLNAGIMAAVVGWLIFSFPSSAKLQQRVSEDYPTAALELMQRQHVNGRIFNDYGWGAYMEWSAPELKPFIDTRLDLFLYNGVFDDCIRATALKDSFGILDKYKIEYVLLPPHQPLTYLLEHSPAWHSIYTDKVAVLFERTPATATAVSASKN
ncbi:MAG: hypothetical protein ABSC64_18990 [Candidatus Korobacteraceae bacterium]